MDLVTLDPLTSTYESGPELLDSRIRYRQISTCVRRKTSKHQSPTATSVQRTIVLAPMCIIPVCLREIVSNRLDHSIKFPSRILFGLTRLRGPRSTDSYRADSTVAQLKCERYDIARSIDDEFYEVLCEYAQASCSYLVRIRLPCATSYYDDSHRRLRYQAPAGR